MVAGYCASDATIFAKHMEQGLSELQAEKALDSLKLLAPAMFQLMDLMVQCFKANGSQSINWTMPDGFTVYHRVLSRKKFNLFDDQIGKVHYDVELEEPNPKNFRSLVPNYVHSWDAYVLRQIVLRLHAQDIKVWVIHDAFRVHPNHAYKLLDVVKEIYAEIFQGNYLVKHIKEMFNIAIELEQDLTSEDVTSSTHLLT